MDERRREELKAAYHTLCEYMLWRKGRTDKLSFDEKEIGVALEIATGALLDYVACDTELHTTQISLNSCEQALGELRQKHKELEQLTKNCEKSVQDDVEKVRILDQSVFDPFGSACKYAAVDSDGACWVYTAMPVLASTGWVPIIDEGSICYKVNGRFNTEYWDKEILARGIGELGVYDQSVFDKADPKFKYAAVDQDFKGYLYVEKPVLCEEEGKWKTSQPHEVFSFSGVGVYAVADWENSLICRQESESEKQSDCHGDVDMESLPMEPPRYGNELFDWLDQRYPSMKFNYIAVDRHGFAIAYTHRPELVKCGADASCWLCTAEGNRELYLGNYVIVDWENSLLCRQTNTSDTAEQESEDSNVATLPKKKKLEQSIFQMLDYKYKYAAVDRGGFLRVFTRKPRISRDCWVSRGGEFEFFGAHYDDSNWKESLIKRGVEK